MRPHSIENPSHNYHQTVCLIRNVHTLLAAKHSRHYVGRTASLRHRERGLLSAIAIMSSSMTPFILGAGVFNIELSARLTRRCGIPRTRLKQPKLCMPQTGRSASVVEQAVNAQRSLNSEADSVLSSPHSRQSQGVAAIVMAQAWPGHHMNMPGSQIGRSSVPL